MSTARRLITTTLGSDRCPLCGRPNLRPSDHHVVPRARGGRGTLTVCEDCHMAIHETFSNKELERSRGSASALLAHEGFARVVAFIAKQDPRRRTRTRRAREQRRRGRNG